MYHAFLDTAVIHIHDDIPAAIIERIDNVQQYGKQPKKKRANKRRQFIGVG